MEQPSFKMPKLDLGSLALSVALGVIVATALYQAQVKGLFSFNKTPVLPSTNQETRTVLKEENSVISVSEKVSPSVVAIGVNRRIINPFDPFSTPKTTDSTIGTGFVVSDKGIIVTNKHVVSDPKVKYSVVTKDGQKFEAKSIYRDPILDLAMVQIEGSNLKAVEIGDSSKLKVGQTAIAIGNALGQFTNTLTTGVISGVGRKVVAGDPFSGSSESLDNLIQTDAAINPGNSGGPLLNLAGQVIGVNVATTEGAQNIGFAIPINSVKQIVDEFIAKGSVSRPFLGVSYKFISKDVAILNEIPQGAYVQDLINGAPAQKAGVKIGDIITKINSLQVNSESTISEQVKNSSIGSQIEITVWREGKQVKVTAILEELPGQ